MESTPAPPMKAAPSVAFAVLCRGVRKQLDGSLDVTGVVGHTIVLETVPVDTIVRTLPGVVLLALDGRSHRGSCLLTLRVCYPNNVPGQSVSRLAEFSDEAPRLLMQFPITIPVQRIGFYAIDVLCDQDRLARITWTVVEREHGADEPVP